MNISNLQDTSTKLCPYCPGFLVYESVGNLWRCSSCQVIRIFEKGTGIITQIDCDLKDKMYTVSLYHIEEVSKILTWGKYDEVDVRFGDVIMVFNFIIDITPQNIKEKLQTILTFL
jgi:hypothetical protein